VNYIVFKIFTFERIIGARKRIARAGKQAARARKRITRAGKQAARAGKRITRAGK
jgi:hypothetical protein